MSHTGFVCAATSDLFGDLMDDIGGVHLHHLAPFTTLLVRTMNSLYRVVITQGSEVCVQGGAFFPDPASAHLDGASLGVNCLRAGWIGVGLRVEFRSGGRRIVTSPVRAIAIVQASGTLVHELSVRADTRIAQRSRNRAASCRSG
jgi:hypothetical protein